MSRAARGFAPAQTYGNGASMNNYEKYRDVFVRVFSVTPEELEKGFAFRTQEDWDSILHMSLISELEDVFGVLFETDDILNFGSYENGMKILERCGVSFENG